jgi:hypothetical protein
VIAPVRAVAVLLYLFRRDTMPDRLAQLARIPLAVFLFGFGRGAVGLIAAGLARFVRHIPTGIELLVQCLMLRRMGMAR